MQDSDQEQWVCSTQSFDLSLDLHRYDFEYEDDDDEESGDIGIENKYYNAKQMKVDNPDEAIDEFLGMPAMEEEKGDWCVLSSNNMLRVNLQGYQGFQGSEAGHQIRIQARPLWQGG